MDELLPIKKLSQIQIRIREALKNAPPLTITKKTTTDDLIVFEDQKKSEESLFDRYLKHKKTNGSENKNSVHKWTELKDIMILEMETKRMESLKIKEINQKLENEEFDEKEDNLETILNEEIDDKCGENEELEESDNSSDVTDEEVEDQELDGDNEEEEESERELNPFLDEEAEDDREDRHQMDESLESDSNDSNDSFGSHIISEQKERSFTEEFNEKNGLNNSALNSSFNSLDESYERRLCATQKIALSPFISQRPKPRFTSKEGFPDLISNLQSNNEEFNSQSLLDLCSGNFSQNDKKVLTQSEIDLENSYKSDSENEFNDRYSVLSEDEEVLSGSKKVGKVFNIESEDEDNDIDLRTTNDVMISLKSFNESDDEEIVNTADELEKEGEDIDGTEEEEPQNVNSFFDNEAELSGSEVSSDEEEDNEDDTQDVEEEELEDLPSESEIEDQNKRYFNKQILDEEKRNIMIWKERLFEDGDLHDDGRQRQKKFRWNFTTDNNFVNDYINEDSDDNYMDSDEDGKTETPTLKMSETEANKKSDKFKTHLSLKSVKNICSDSKNNVNSISAFVVRDQRLNTIMSFKSKRISDSKNSFKSNKKLKTSKKNTKISIFDLLNN